MRVAIGSDHRGYLVKDKLIQMLEGWGHTVRDVGAHSEESVDYPDIAALVGQLVAQQQVERGILVCGTGIGMAITANKIPGIRATTCNDEISAEMCRRHNDVNVLCLSGDLLGERNPENMLRLWLETEFEGGRHARRLGKIADLESQQLPERTESGE
ncbi:MAG: ribose 5-phosphate isomerase B [Pirellulaceae bacterium]|jgi:ribose 5-phosphate isomerase B|nr:ribose 5-phosphate isomerase B [Planctomycetaceae bacterium]MDP6443893.1 ribose 5-phosphate isomerase B [Pirellulaceae bacterium]MDP7014824.1 ribose 5-phosphate isomerase B [Pirellulaceae bacterium]